jgi:hypothetical protein
MAVAVKAEAIHRRLACPVRAAPNLSEPRSRGAVIWGV